MAQTDQRKCILEYATFMASKEHHSLIASFYLYRLATSFAPFGKLLKTPQNQEFLTSKNIRIPDAEDSGQIPC